jgi:hypothetical protein
MASLEEVKFTMDSMTLFNLWPPTSYGRHSSLYRDLSESDIEHLEKAICLHMVSDFEGSLRIFAALDEREGNHPAVALEHGLTLCNYKKFDKACRAFQKALDCAGQEIPLALGADEHLLLRLWRGWTEMHLSATLTSAWISMKDARERLKMLSLDTYTDVQVSPPCSPLPHRMHLIVRRLVVSLYTIRWRGRSVAYRLVSLTLRLGMCLSAQRDH